MVIEVVCKASLVRNVGLPANRERVFYNDGRAGTIQSTFKVPVSEDDQLRCEVKNQRVCQLPSFH